MTLENGTGGCLCGATSYRWTGEAKFSIRCFCRECQRASGGGHMPQLAVPSEGFDVTGASKSYKSKAQSGSDLEFGFCGDCGSPLWKSTSKAPALVFVMAGSLETPEAFPPPKDVFEDCRLDWDRA